MVLHHVGIVVDSLAEAIPLFEVWLGARRIGGIVEDEVQEARIQLFLLNDNVLLEVVEAIPGRKSPLHATGEFHLCFTVPNVDEEMRRLSKLGMVTRRPSATAALFDNRPIGFLTTHSGQLIELLEDTAGPVQ